MESTIKNGQNHNNVAQIMSIETETENSLSNQNRLRKKNSLPNPRHKLSVDSCFESHRDDRIIINTEAQ